MYGIIDLVCNDENCRHELQAYVEGEPVLNGIYRYQCPKCGKLNNSQMDIAELQDSEPLGATKATFVKLHANVILLKF